MYTDAEMAEIKDFMVRLENGEVGESEIKEIEDALEKEGKTKAESKIVSSKVRNQIRKQDSKKLRTKRKLERTCKRRARNGGKH